VFMTGALWQFACLLARIFLKFFCDIFVTVFAAGSRRHDHGRAAR